jgi:uridine kinase
MPEGRTSAQDLIERISQALRLGRRPFVVALDGRGGSGKSTACAAIERELDAAIIDGDDFYDGAPAARWELMTPAERADRCIDWRRQRAILESLAGGRAARWRPYDWDADDGRLSTHWWTCSPDHDVVVLEGTFSARPELADLLDLRVMLDVSPSVQRARFIEREGTDAWHAWEKTWMEAEDHYFTSTMPPESFDVIVRG